MPNATCVVCSGPLTGRQTVVCSKPCRNQRLLTSEAFKKARAKYRTTEKYRSSRAAKRLRDHDKPCPGGCGTLIRRDSPRCWACTCPGPPPPRTRLRYDCCTRCGALSVAAHNTPKRACSCPERVWVAGRCRRCESPFIIIDQMNTSYCTRRCLVSDARDRRRALERDAYVEHVYRGRVFERDKWRCQLCGKPVNKTAVVPHPMAPTLDHIVPLAAGGEHSMANTQCAHFLCNSIKGTAQQANSSD